MTFACVVSALSLTLATHPRIFTVEFLALEPGSKIIARVRYPGSLPPPATNTLLPFGRIAELAKALSSWSGPVLLNVPGPPVGGSEQSLHGSRHPVAKSVNSRLIVSPNSRFILRESKWHSRFRFDNKAVPLPKNVAGPEEKSQPARVPRHLGVSPQPEMFLATSHLVSPITIVGKTFGCVLWTIPPHRDRTDDVFPGRAFYVIMNRLLDDTDCFA